MKMPKLPKIAFPRRPKKLQATATARRAPAADDYYDDEPKTNLSSAFIVVLILHVVAVGGIYAFNSIKAARRGQEPPPVSATSATSDAALLVAKSPAPTQVALEEKTHLAEPVVNKAPRGQTYVVKPNDNLTRIAAQSGTSVSDLEEANSMKNGASLRPGQTLIIPTGKVAKAAPSVIADPRKAAFLNATGTSPTVAATAKATGRTYTVAKGDTPTSIGRKFGISAEDLLKLNKIDNPKKMQLGQTLKLPARKAN